MPARRIGVALLGLACLWLPIWSSPIHAQGGTEGLPGGATSLKEIYDKWTVSCAMQTVDGKATKSCAASQEQIEQRSQQRVLAIDLQPTASGAAGTLLLPFGFALENGIVLQIDGGPPTAPMRFRTCLAVGCILPLTFDAKTLVSLRKGTTLKLRGVADSGKEIFFDISLAGFASALDRTAVLSK